MNNKYIVPQFVLIAISLLYVSGNCFAQHEHDDKPVNLKVLPKDISDKELHKIMDSFTYALGEHCNFCHGNPKDQSTKKTDFAADVNPNKDIARDMMKMVGNINNNLLKGARALNPDISKIECVTCHRGSAHIDKLEDVLFETYTKDGLDTAMKKYDDLKQQYYGSFTFDFRDHTLLSLASKVFDAGKSDDALKIANKAVELFPASASAFTFVGNIYMKNGNNEQAIKNFEKAVQLEPRNRFANEMLRRLKEFNK